MPRYEKPAIRFVIGRPTNSIQTDSTRLIWANHKQTYDIITALMQSYSFVLTEEREYSPLEFARELAAVCDVNTNARNRFFMHILMEMEFWNLVLEGFDQRDDAYVLVINHLTAAIYRREE